MTIGLDVPLATKATLDRRKINDQDQPKTDGRPVSSVKSQGFAALHIQHYELIFVNLQIDLPQGRPYLRGLQSLWEDSF